MDQGVHPSSWKAARLGEVCELRKATVHPADYPDMQYVGLEHIDSGNPKLKRNGIATEVNSTKSRFFAGDILYGKLRPYLDKAVLAEFDGLCSTDILVLKPNKLALSEYLINVIHKGEFLSYAISSSKGVNHPRTSWSSLSDFQFKLPSIPEQRAISHVLRTVQQAREARLRELELERECKAALMEHLFTHGTRGEPTKQTEIGEMPKSWDIVKLGDVLTSTQYGLSLCGNTDGSYPILRMNCLVDGYVYGSDLQYVELEKAEFEKFRLNIGDLLFNRTNSLDLVGKTGLFNLDGDFVFASYLIRLAVDKNKLSSEFCNYYMNMNSIQNRLRLLASRGVSQSNINATKLRSFHIPLPPLSEQMIITDLLKACDSNIFSIDREAHLLYELFRAMLEELMTGRLSSKGIIG